MSPAGRTVLGSTGAPDDARPAMIRTWLVAAVALVVGIVIGFASGFTAADRLTPRVTGTAGPDAAVEESMPGRPFSEAAVAPAVNEPVRVEPDSVVPENEVAPAPPPAPRARPALTERAARVEGPAVPAPVEGPGSMQVLSRPSGAQVILDGRNVGRTPLSLAEVPEGSHAIRLDLAGFKPWSTTVDVMAGQRMRVAASLEQ